jgi:serine/threonine protein kinase
MVNDQFDIKITDFGFSSYSNQTDRSMFGGSKSYMAPEVIVQKKHDGFKSDIFAMGVILFVMAMGNFPFHEASKKDKYYCLAISSKPEKTRSYWKAVNGKNTSHEFRDLF